MVTEADFLAWATNVEDVRLPALEANVVDLQQEDQTLSWTITQKSQELSDQLTFHSIQIQSLETDLISVNSRATLALNQYSTAVLNARTYTDQIAQNLRDEFGLSTAALQSYVDGGFYGTITNDISAAGSAFLSDLTAKIAEVQAIQDAINTVAAAAESARNSLLNVQIPDMLAKIEANEESIFNHSAEYTALLAGYPYATIAEGMVGVEEVVQLAQSGAEAAQSLAEVAQAAAQAASTAAAAAKDEAVSSAGIAEGAAGAANTSATSAGVSETSASQSATAAAASATIASTAAGSASASESSAATSASSALGSSNSAVSSADLAATAASNAGDSATAAASSASSAAASATAASQSASASETSRLAAETARSSAESAETSAVTSATSAQSSSAAAASSATDAANSATLSGTKADAASLSASDANTWALDAQAAASTASTAEGVATQASLDAATSASSAATQATAAASYATQSSQNATAANTARVAAETAQTAASVSETNSANSASSALASSASAASSKDLAAAILTDVQNVETGLTATINDIKALDVNALTGTAMGTFLTQMAVSAGGTSATVTNQGAAISDISGYLTGVASMTAELSDGKIAGIRATVYDGAGGSTSGSLLELIGDNVIATGTLSGNRIVANSIGATELAANSITAAALAAGSVTADAIAAATITGDRLSANTITAANIAANTITGNLLETSGIITSSAQINDAMIENAKIKNAAVDTLKIAGYSVVIPQSATGAWGTTLTINIPDTTNSVVIYAVLSNLYATNGNYTATMLIDGSSAKTVRFGVKDFNSPPANITGYFTVPIMHLATLSSGSHTISFSANCVTRYADITVTSLITRR